MFYSSELSLLMLLEGAFLVILLLVHTVEAQDTVIQEPPVILLHNDAQSLREVMATDFGSGTSIRLSLVCAAYGEPDYPIITWSSPTNGVEDYAILAMNDDSINVFNDQQLLPNSQLPVTVSILELCNFRPENLTDYLCVAINSNSPRQSTNLSRAQLPLGAFAVTYSFATGNVALSYYEMATPTTAPPTTGVTSPSQPTALGSAAVAIISTLVVCTVVISVSVVTSTAIVVMYKSRNKGSREKTRGRNLAYRQRAQTDSDSLYECNAYTTTTNMTTPTHTPITQQAMQSTTNNRQHQGNTDRDSMYECTAYGGHDRNRQSQQDLSHTYNYIDAPTSPKGKKMAETFAVYQCPAYGAQDEAIPPPVLGDLTVGYSGITETGETVYNYVEESVTDHI